MQSFRDHWFIQFGILFFLLTVNVLHFSSLGASFVSYDLSRRLKSLITAAFNPKPDAQIGRYSQKIMARLQRYAVENHMIGISRRNCWPMSTICKATA